MLTDSELEKIGATLYEVLMRLSKEAGVEMCLVWGCKNGEETVEAFARTKDLAWEDCCKIVMGGTASIVDSYV